MILIRNPYSELIGHMRTQGGKNNTPYVQVGVVVSVDPLTIKLGDLQIGKDNLLVAEYLLPNYARKYSASGNIKFVTTISVDTDNTQNGDLTFTDGLAENDIVALISTLDEQTYIVLAKVVSP